MLEKICPVHNVPVYRDRCIKDDCDARPLVSTTIYWCDHCKVPVFEKECGVCGTECTYMATDSHKREVWSRKFGKSGVPQKGH